VRPRDGGTKPGLLGFDYGPTRLRKIKMRGVGRQFESGRVRTMPGPSGVRKTKVESKKKKKICYGVPGGPKRSSAKRTFKSPVAKIPTLWALSWQKA